MRRQFWFRMQRRPDRAKKGTGIACDPQAVMQSQSIASIAAISLSPNTKQAPRVWLPRPRRNTIHSPQIQQRNRRPGNRPLQSLLLQSLRYQRLLQQCLLYQSPCGLRDPQHHTPRIRQFLRLHRRRPPRYPKRRPHPRRNQLQCITPEKRRLNRYIPRVWSKPANDRRFMCLKKSHQYTGIDSP